MHPILDALNGTQHEWIKKLLFTFNEGNIGKFEALAPLFPKEVRSLTYNIHRLGLISDVYSQSSKKTTPSSNRKFVSWRLLSQCSRGTRIIGR